jgi:HNH endonuclease
MIRELPSAEYLRECFVYERRTGKFFWKKRPLKHFVNRAAWARWNARYPGTQAFITKRKGYLYSHIDGKLASAHRVIWKIETGQEPPALLDHKNRRRDYNIFSNLRAISHLANCFNRARKSNNSSGHIGVYARRGRWYAYLNLSKQMIWLGSHSTRRAAINARKQGELKYLGAIIR